MNEAESTIRGIGPGPGGAPLRLAPDGCRAAVRDIAAHHAPQVEPAFVAVNRHELDREERPCLRQAKVEGPPHVDLAS